MKRLLLILILLAGQSAAQGVWQSYGPEQAAVVQGASVCPYNDPEAGNAFCFGLSCSPGAVVEFSLIVAGTDLPDSVDVQIEMDNALAGTLVFNRTSQGEVFEYKAGYHPQWHGDLVQRLKTGQVAVLKLTSRSGQKIRQLIGLSGSSRALDLVIEACPD